MNGLAAIDGGMAYHTRTLRQGRFAPLFDALIRLPALSDADLSQFSTIVIPCRTNGRRLARDRDRLAAFVDAGGFLVVLGETRPNLFLDGVTFDPVPTNFWWWLDPGADLGVRISAPHHPLMASLSPADVTWHVHGTLHLAEGGTTLASWQSGDRGGPIMVETQRGHGRLLLTSLDPVYHHGSGFMPATTRFLDVFFPWLAAETQARSRRHTHA
ncbi:MAG: hypothetical protein AAF914_00100 [Pseudomonadota bacterium]